ncbi:MAG TPA: hypothetical protein VHQ65_12505, partial [Thermoanaerobaculia bacterium]|nr:hypothetical protein [Thermoanaerobaculia bacterium]
TPAVSRALDGAAPAGGAGRVDGEGPAAAEGGAEPPPAAEPAEGADKSLEEVQEIHLRDSFWSVS